MKTLKSWEEVERILRDRIKFIGDNEQIYTGCPADLLKELRQAFQEMMGEAVEVGNLRSIKIQEVVRYTTDLDESIAYDDGFDAGVDNAKAEIRAKLASMGFTL